MPNRVPVTFLFAVAVAAAASGQAAAPEEPPAPRQVFAETVEVNVVNVDVFVTDKNGNRVRDLTQEDFELLVGGEHREITNFYVVDGTAGEPRRTPAAAVKNESTEDADSAPVKAPRPAVTPSERRLHLVIYVDNFNLHPLTRDRALGIVRSFVRRRLAPDDLAMVVSYDGSINVRQPFTADRGRLLDALLEMEEKTGFATAADRERKDVLRLIYDADELIEVSGAASQYAESLYFDVNRSIDALKGFVDSMAGLPGRKAILYLSDGIPMRAGEDVFVALDERFDEGSDAVLRALNYDVSREFRAVTAQANANRIVFYSVGTMGLRPDSSADVENYHVNRSSFVDSTYMANLQDSLHYLANETGGQVIVNTNNIAPLLERVGDDFGTYYSLGFVNSGGGSGRYFELEVRVKGRKGLDVRHRPGFRDKPLATQMAEGTMASLQFGVESNPLDVTVEFGKAAPRGRDNILLPMVVKLPMAKLAFLPSAGRYQASVRLFISAADDDGKVSNVDQIQVPIDIPGELFAQAQEHSYQFQHALLLRRETRAVAMGVRDEIGLGRSFLLLRP